MRNNLIALVFFLCGLELSAANLQTAQIASYAQFGGTAATAQASIRKIIRNSQGDILVLYAFAQNITTPLSFTAPTTSWGTAVIKYDAGFNMIKEKLFLSNKAGGTTDVQTVPLDMTIDASDNVYVVGYATGESLIWSYNGEDINTTPVPTVSVSGNRMFMVKASRALQPIANQMIQAEGAQMCSAVFTSKGTLAVCGYYSSSANPTADFGNGVTMTKSSTTTYEQGFVVFYNSDMVAQKVIPITSNYRAYTYRLAADTAGNIYVAGAGYGTLKFGEYSGQSIGTSGTTNQHIFCTSYTPSGDYRWSSILRGTGSERVEGIATDKSGNVFMVGHQGTSSVMDWVAPSGVAQPVIMSANPSKATPSMLLMKVNGQNGKLMWYNMMSSASGTDHLGAVATDADGDVYVAGTLNGTADMNPNGNPNIVNASNYANQGVIAKYGGLDGRCLFAYSEGGSGGKISFKTSFSTMIGRAQLMITPQKNIFWGAVFEQSVQLQLSGSSPITMSTAAGRSLNYTDMFVLRLTQSLPGSYASKPTLTPAVKNIPYAFSLNYSGLPVGATYTALDALPAGLSLSSDGVLSGTMASEGDYFVRVGVKNGSTLLYSDVYTLSVISSVSGRKQVLASTSDVFSLDVPAQTPSSYTLSYSINDKSYANTVSGLHAQIPFSAFPNYHNMLYYKLDYNVSGNQGAYVDSVFVIAIDNTQRAPGGVLGAKLWMRSDIGTKTVPDGSANEYLMKGQGWQDISGGSPMNLYSLKKNSASVNGPLKVVKSLNGEQGYNFTALDSIVVEGSEFNYHQTMFGVADFGPVSGTGTVLGLYEPYAYDPSANVSNQLKYFFTLASSKFYTYDARANLSVSAQAGPNLFYTDFKTDRADALLLNGAQRLSSITQNYSARTNLMYASPVLGARSRSDGQISTFMQGDIYEVISFPRVLSDTERWRVESYLAFKYGLTLYGNSIGSMISSMRRNYYLSDGSICYSAKGESKTVDHFMYMTALVRDDVSMLHKKQATPYGNGTYNMNVPLADTLSVILKQLVNGSNRNQPQDLANDKDYFIVGSQSFIYSDKQFETNFALGSKPMIYETWKQSWFVRRSASMNTVCLQFDLSKIPYFGKAIVANQVGLMVMDTSDCRGAKRFTFIPATSYDTLTHIANFDGVNIPDESFLKIVYSSSESIRIQPDSVPAGRVRDMYRLSFQASAEGSTEFTYSLTSGSLPEGMTLSSDGNLSGSPLGISGEYVFVVRATDQRGFYAEKSYRLKIDSDVNCAPIAQTRILLHAGTLGENTRKSIQLKDLNGYKVTEILEGSLPKGLKLSGNLLSGVPQEAGETQLLVRVKDQNACEGEVVFDVNIDLPTKLQAKSVLLYPNPAYGEVNLSVSAMTTAPIRVQVFNAASIRVKDVSFPAGTRNAKINLSGLAPGQYFVLISSDGAVVNNLLLVK